MALPTHASLHRPAARESALSSGPALSALPLAPLLWLFPTEIGNTVSVTSAVPWIVLCVMAVAFVFLWLVYLRVDVRFRIRRDATFATSGSFRATDRWLTDRTPADALGNARQAIEAIGGKDLVQVGSDCVYGWVGNVWINIAKYAQYQLLVSVEGDFPGRTAVTCSVRPRIPLLGGSEGVSSEWLQRLSHELRATTIPDPLGR